MQGHQNMEGRAIVVEATLKDYLKNPSANIHKHEALSLWPKHEYKGYRWGMSIDQNACIGCSACIVACQSENNIPVVGKKYVLEGREMHWMRIDRYFSGSEINGDIPDNPDTYFQPMLCQHCENAPCETVCPVLATTHSEEGLNEMTYNRCVGTRYCSNNCPYKVRRFNWFAYTAGERTIDTPNKAYNPDVTVRSRGVMEKCTFCIQRIKEVKHDAVIAGRKIKDGEITTACEQTCPTDAIVFGDMNNPESRVSKLQADARAYKVLEELNTEPSVRYLTKIRNTDHVSTGHGGHES
jgi:Fe-S-cluster-containing dehydrogenase component